MSQVKKDATITVPPRLQSESHESAPTANNNGNNDDWENFEISLDETGRAGPVGSYITYPAYCPDDEASTICEENPETGIWECRPYKRDKLQAEMDHAKSNGKTKKEAILETLQKMSITCYIVPHDSPNMLKDLSYIVDKVSHENRHYSALFNPNVKQRVLLFEDHEGRLFNLTVAAHAVGPSSYFSSVLESFSGTQAMIALTVLCRSFPCAVEENIDQLRPAYLSLILGLVLSEETSLSWLNANMLVRSMPSVSAHTLMTNIGSDWLRKILTLALALAGAATGKVQQYMTIGGISLACTVLLANLGSRAWYFLKWRPLAYTGPFSPFIGYLCAVFAGFFVPYMGHREVEAGGKRALESVLLSAVIVAVIFVLSDIDQIQKLTVVGSETCPQDPVNFAVGIWWTLTLMASMVLVARVKPDEHFPRDDERFLMPSEASPVGYLVPNLPNFVVDPNLVKKGSRCLSLHFELMLGFVFATAMGFAIVYMSFTDLDDEYTGNSSFFKGFF